MCKRDTNPRLMVCCAIFDNSNLFAIQNFGLMTYKNYLPTNVQLHTDEYEMKDMFI